VKHLQWTLGLALGVFSFSALAEPLDFSGDIRFGYSHFERDERNGTQIDDSQLRLRVRAGMLWTLSDTYSFKGRYAARMQNKGNDSEFRFYRGLRPGSSSITPGQSTFDEFFLRARYGSWDHRVGRFQTNNRLVGVAAKSFSRTNSTSWDVGWTDGIQSTYRAASGWSYTGLIERNDKDGPSNLRRAPLGFEKSASRASYYFSVDSTDTSGVWAQRSVDVTFIPSALYYNGLSQTANRDYLAFTGRLAAQFTLREQMKLVSGIELAYAPETPARSAMNLPGTGKSSGTAFQVSVNLMDIQPGHSLGFVYGENDAGWLLSTDFINNQSLTELRYAWRPMTGHLLEARIRERKDLIQPLNTVRKRSETDGYLRYSISI
jgi:hypothetical protein